jgi:hypothetical protein
MYKNIFKLYSMSFKIFFEQICYFLSFKWISAGLLEIIKFWIHVCKKSGLGPSICAELGRPVGLHSWAGLLGYAGWFGISGLFSDLRKELEGHQQTLTPVSKPRLLWLLFRSLNFRESLVYIPKLQNCTHKISFNLWNHPNYVSNLDMRGFKNGFVLFFFI